MRDGSTKIIHPSPDNPLVSPFLTRPQASGCGQALDKKQRVLEKQLSDAEENQAAEIAAMQVSSGIAGVVCLFICFFNLVEEYHSFSFNIITTKMLFYPS